MTPDLTLRYAVIGDVGGHHQALRAELTRLGADPDSGTIPADLRIVQVGDLVHRGPDSRAVVALVDRFLTAAAPGWVQLVGNHEAQYLRAPTFKWHQRLDGETIAILRRWWGDGLMTVATVVPAGDADLLVTHAGLTEGFWRADLGQPASAVRAAEMLNMMGALGRTSIFRGGAMLGGSRSASAGPMWASASMELLPSWLGRRMPFGQIHGHSSAYDWQRECFRAAEAIAARTRLDHDCGHEITSFDGGEIVGIDPGHGAHVPHPWQAWVTSAA
ncbi:metallophosphoesterase [Nostocoides vanveenii]|uniref:metallophosphoesterase n=1 Tax=Nostocoides vanveenii TaxID=330835 RepID=UPI0031E15BD0